MYFNVHVEHVLNLGLFSHFLCYDFFKRIEKIIAAMIIYLHKLTLYQVNPFLLTPNILQRCKSFEFHGTILNMQKLYN